MLQRQNLAQGLGQTMPLKPAVNERALVAVDFGLTSTKVLAQVGGLQRRALFASTLPITPAVLRAALAAVDLDLQSCRRVAVTGSQHAKLGDSADGVPLLHVNEAQAAGVGALDAMQLQQALVVSAGTGTAMIAARSLGCKHVFGTAVGGGTLAGLGRLALGLSDPREIDALAIRGNPAGADLTIVDAVGQALNYLPEDMTAVNLGRVGRGATPSREDLAAGLVTLVAQTISLIAISTARAEAVSPIVFVGNLLSMPAMRAACDRVASLYGTTFVYAAAGAFVGARGALLQLQAGNA